ncbi:hypothetical protein HS125_03150 [bacterium]|nr:hypothetical protein [bacterium]
MSDVILPDPQRELERRRPEDAGSVTELFEAFPRQGPPPPPYRGPESERSRYVLPFLLVGLVALVLVFSYLSTPRPADLSPTAATTALLSEDRRLSEAEKLVLRGDQLWDEGYRGWNDKTLLAESAHHYREAWWLLTGRKWNSATHAANVTITPVSDSSRARILCEKIRNRLMTLEATLR